MALKNINYDLVKMLHGKMDTVWRLENFYCKDAEQVKCHSIKALEKILADEKEHIRLLIAEIKMRIDAGVFD
jgi:hypothetical protein